MTTATKELIEIKADEKVVLAQYHVTPEAVALMVAPYRELSIAGVNDTKGYRAVDEARKVLKKTRNAIDNRRKELNRGALDYKSMVDSAAKQLIGVTEEVEEELSNKLKAIDAEKDRIKQQRLQTRIDRLAAIGASFDVRQLEAMSDATFEELHAAKAEEHEAKLKQEAEEAEQRRLQEEQIARDREELARMKKEQDEREAAEAAAKLAKEERKRKLIANRQFRLKPIGINVPDSLVAGLSDEEFESYLAEQLVAAEAKRQQEAEFAAERERLAAIERQQQADRDAIEAQRRQAELEQAARDAAEKARIETEARLKKEAEDAAKAAVEKAEREEAERLRQEALKPDREKLLAIAEAVKAIEIPKVSEAAKEVLESVIHALADCEFRIREIIEESLSKLANRK